MHRQLNQPRAWSGPLRRGITVIEVLFAMGIALAGLLGIAALLLLAGRQAGDSNRAAEAQSFAHEWYSDFVVRGLNRSSEWYWCNDVPATPVFGAFSKTLSATTPTKGSTTLFRRELGRESVCLDPYFFNSRDVDVVAEIAPNGWYRPSVFPYYSDRYNPMLDPAYTTGIPAYMWPDQPRMLRVTSGYSTSAGVTRFTSRVLDRVFGSEDDVNVYVDDKDRSLAPDRASLTLTTAPTLPAKFTAKSEYSWLATLCPNEPSDWSISTTTDLYTLSLVVIKNRDRIYLPTTMTARAINTPPIKDQAPQGESALWVEPLSGNFVGGSGGEVQLRGNDAMKAGVSIGDWIMLGKYYSATAVTGTPEVRPNSIFRWYRVVGAQDFAVTDTMTDPYGNNLPAGHTVWTQNVILDGPDWMFMTPPLTVTTSGGPVTIQTITTGTLIKGAVSVFERVVTIPN